MPFMREYPSPADFLANAERGMVFPNLRSAVYKASTLANDATTRKNEFNRAVDSTIVGGPITYTSDSASWTANGAAPNRQMNTGIAITGDVMVYLLTQKTGAMGIFSASLAASNANIIGFMGSATDIGFHNGNTSGQSAKINWPADIGTKKLFACGWGRVHGFPFMAVGLAGVMSAVVSGAAAGQDRVPSAGDHQWWFARPNGGNGIGVTTVAALFSRVDAEAAILAEAQAVYDNLRAIYANVY